MGFGLRNKLLPIFCVLVLFSACKNKLDDENKNTQNYVPTLDEISASWVSADTITMEPSIRNFRGQALLNKDMTSISWFVSAPYSGEYHSGALRINGVVPQARKFRWQPYQGLRKGKLNTFDIESTTRMLVDGDAVMWQVKITNTDSVRQNVDVDLDLIGFISKFGGHWNWWYPQPNLSGKRDETRRQEIEDLRNHILENDSKEKAMADRNWPTDEEILNSNNYSSNIDGNIIYVHDKKSPAVTVFSVVTAPDRLEAKNSGGKASWKFDLAAGETKTIKYLMAYGDDTSTLKENANHWTKNFGKTFASTKAGWQKKWKRLFKPHNKLVSGCFPVLETDDEASKRVYYTGPLTLLYLLNTNLPQHDRVYLTGGPKWGATTTFFWDISIWSKLWAVVDPVMMKEQLIDWIKIDPGKFYGEDNFGGAGVGNGYSANYWCLFKLVRDYIVVSGDYDFLDEKINAKPVLGYLEDYAIKWKEQSLYGTPGCTEEVYKLADFGDDAVNLLECVPTYKHIVPSFNIGYVWMMKETANFYGYKQETEKSDYLRAQTKEMTANILKLYAGNGFWNSLYPNGKKVEVRHVLDFIYFGKIMSNEVTPTVKQEILNFFYRELKTDRWMRAQSLSDIAADYSDRPDHGPMGSFDGWIAESMDALTQMGNAGDALDFYHTIEPVTHEGCWSQAHELWGKNKRKKSARVRIAERGWNCRESSAGIAISQVMLKDFFGFDPQINGDIIDTTRNAWPFKGKGKLRHVYYDNAYHTIDFKNDRPMIIKESSNGSQTGS